MCGVTGIGIGVGEVGFGFQDTGQSRPVRMLFGCQDIGVRIGVATHLCGAIGDGRLCRE